MSNLSDLFKRKKYKSRPIQKPLTSKKSTTVVTDKQILSADGYDIGRKLDSGTFATVRYAEKTTDKGTVSLAVKVIDKTKASPLFTQKFLRNELTIWPKLHHRHIIQVENIYSFQDCTYVFMELASRGSVIEYLQTHGAVDEDLGRSWCKRMCQALRYCHNKGIAHRDLKCDNLLLDKDLQIKIGDFGFCCHSFDWNRGTFILSETYCGSSSYVAPEVIEAKPYDTIPADIWSAGVCIYVILNNAMPFDDSNIAKMHEDQVRRRWHFAPEADKRLSRSAKNMMIKILEPVVEKRPTLDQVLRSTWMRNPVVDLSSYMNALSRAK